MITSYSYFCQLYSLIHIALVMPLPSTIYRRKKKKTLLIGGLVLFLLVDLSREKRERDVSFDEKKDQVSFEEGWQGEETMSPFLKRRAKYPLKNDDMALHLKTKENTEVA